MRADVDSVMDRFEDLRAVMGALHTEALLAVDVTMSQAQLMSIVASRPAIGMSALAARLNVGLSSVSGLVERLVEHGYVDRAEDPADRRQHLVTLTPAGSRVVDRMRELDHSVFRRLAEGLSPPELDAAQVAIEAFVREATRLSSADQPGVAEPPAAATDRERTPA